MQGDPKPQPCTVLFPFRSLRKTTMVMHSSRKLSTCLSLLEKLNNAATEIGKRKGHSYQILFCINSNSIQQKYDHSQKQKNLQQNLMQQNKLWSSLGSVIRTNAI